MDCGNGHGDCNAIFTADAYGANAAQITFPVSGVGDWRPDWSPDGTRLVFSRIDNRNGWFQTIMTVNPDGTQLIPVRVGDGTNNNYSFPSWTPDGRIVYVNREIGESTDDGYLEIMNADGSGSQRLTSTPAARVYEPDYSPEGDRIVFKSRLYQTQTFFDVMVMNGDGSNLMNLTNQLLDVGAVEWSPDGSRIAYTVAEPSGGLWLMDADGGNRILLTDGIGAAWRILPTP
jgi:TolB protein